MEAQEFNWLKECSALGIRQEVPLGEILTNIEIRNKYQLLDLKENVIGHIVEESKGLKNELIRNILKSRRPMKVNIYDEEGREMLFFKRPYFWFFAEIQVFHGKRKLGSIGRRFSLFYRFYDLRVPGGRVIAHIKSPLWKPWTFPVINSTDGRKLGVITKQWSGGFKELYTDADHFMVEFPKWSPWKKALLLTAAIMIDLDYFES